MEGDDARGAVFSNSFLVDAIISKMSTQGGMLRAYVAFGKYAHGVSGYTPMGWLAFIQPSVLNDRVVAWHRRQLRVLDYRTGRLLSMANIVPPFPESVTLLGGSSPPITVHSDSLAKGMPFVAQNRTMCMALLLGNQVVIMQAHSTTWRMVMCVQITSAESGGHLVASWSDIDGCINLLLRVGGPGAVVVALRLTHEREVVPTMFAHASEYLLGCVCPNSSIACLLERNSADILFVYLGGLIPFMTTIRIGKSTMEHMAGMESRLREASLIPPDCHRVHGTFKDRVAPCIAVDGHTRHAYIVERWHVEGCCGDCWMLCRMYLPMTAAAHVERRRSVLAAFSGARPLWAVVVGTTYVLAESNDSLLLYRPGLAIRRMRTDSGVMWPKAGAVSLAEYAPLRGCAMLIMQRIDNSGETVLIDVGRYFPL